MMKQFINIVLRILLVTALMFSVCFALVELGKRKPARVVKPAVKKTSAPAKKKAPPKTTNRPKAKKKSNN